MEPLGLLKDAQSVQFVDWAHPDMVGDVLRSGRVSYGHIPSGYGEHSIVETSDDDNVLRFPLRDGGYLKMTPLDGPPEHVDVLVTYRPAEEQPEIATSAIAMGAKSFWVHPPATVSAEAKELCEAAGVVFVEGVDIRDVVRGIVTSVDEAEEHLYPDVRDRAIAALHVGLTNGHMSLTQFESAMGDALAATREAELVAVVRRFAPPVRITPRERRLDEPLAIGSSGMFADIRLRGRWQVGRVTKVQTGPSKIIIDLTDAEFDDWNIDMTLQTGFGDVIMTIPRGMHLVIAGVSAASANKLEAPTPGFPVIRLNVIIGFGRLRLKHPRLTRAEKKALKA